MKSYGGSGSSTTDFGLLLLRLFFGLNLFLHHGLEKVTHFSQMSRHFPDPVHLGSHTSLIFALISDAICSLLVVLGLGTRVAAFIVFVNISVVFYVVHHHPFLGGNGELLLLFIGGFLALVFAGGGRYSLDWKFWGRS
ncbi:MAG: DoxX family protein [Acidobacteriaceae bacterium]